MNPLSLVVGGEDGVVVLFSKVSGGVLAFCIWVDSRVIHASFDVEGRLVRGRGKVQDIVPFGGVKLARF